jgi:uncharacterized glyoxalase superfamily protein PhnB
MNKVTPIFVVEQIEPCLSFWVDMLGFQKTVEIPHGDSLGFVILVNGVVEIMYQSRVSVLEDAPAVLEGRTNSASPNALYIEVSDIGDIDKRLAGWEIILPKRTTFYGMTEIGVREPAGNFVMFAQPVPAKSAAS